MPTDLEHFPNIIYSDQTMGAKLVHEQIFGIYLLYVGLECGFVFDENQQGPLELQNF